MQSFPTKSHTEIQTHYQNVSNANFYFNSGIIVAIVGLLLTLKIIVKKERGTHKMRQQIQQLEKMYLLEYKDNNIR